MGILFLEGASASTYGLEFFSSSSGTVASVASPAHTGSRSIELTSDAYLVRVLSQTDAGRASIWFRTNDVSGTGTPAATTGGMVSIGGLSWRVGPCITTNSKLRFASTGTFTGSEGATTLSADTWYQIILAWDWTSQTVNSFRCWLRPEGGSATLELSEDNITLSSTQAPTRIRHQGYKTDAALRCYISDIYVDDGGLTATGDIRVTAKLPAADNTSGFDTGIGSGTNRYDRTSERAISTTNGWQHAASSDAQENYTLQSASAGDVDITGATILGYTGWVYGKRGERDAVIGGSSTTSDNTNNHTTTVCTAPTVAGGNAVVVAFVCDDDGNPGTTATCADSQGNTYAAANTVQISDTGSGGGVRTAIFVALNATALSGSDTVTVTHGTINASAMIVTSFGGLLSSGTALDKTATQVQNSTDSPSSGSTGALSQAEEVAFAAFGRESPIEGWGTNDGDITQELSGTSPATNGGAPHSNVSLAGFYEAVDSAAALTASLSGAASSRDWAVAVGTYKAQTGAVSYGNPKLHLNGTDYAITLTASNALYTQIVDSASYPSAAAGIGMRSSGTSPDTFLYECGAIIAYTPAVSPIPVPLARRKPYLLRI